MDTVDLVLLTIGLLLLGNIGLLALALRYRSIAHTAQRAAAELVRQRRYAASYDTGLIETPIVQVLDAS